METDAQCNQGPIYRNQQKSARANARQLDRGAAPGRPERQPRDASDDRKAERTQLSDSSERPVELRQCQGYRKPGANAEEEHDGHEHRAVWRGRKHWNLRRVNDSELDLLSLGIGGMGNLRSLAPRYELLVI